MYVNMASTNCDSTNWILHAELKTPCGVLVPQDDAGEELFNITFLAISEDWRAEVGEYNYFINA